MLSFLFIVEKKIAKNIKVYILSPTMDPKRKEELEERINQRVMMYDKVEIQLRNELNFVRVFSR